MAVDRLRPKLLTASLANIRNAMTAQGLDVDVSATRSMSRKCDPL